MPYTPENPFQPVSVLPVVTEDVYESQRAAILANPEDTQLYALRQLGRRDTLLAEWVIDRANGTYAHDETAAYHGLTQAALVYDLLFRQSIDTAGTKIHLEQIPGTDAKQQDILATHVPILPVFDRVHPFREVVSRWRARRSLGKSVLTDVRDHFVKKLLTESPLANDETQQRAAREIGAGTYAVMHDYMSLTR